MTGKQTLRHFEIYDNFSIRTYLGYVRKRYNSYCYGSPESYLHPSVVVLDKKTENLIKFNTEKLNVFKKSKGIPFEEILRKKHKSWTLNTKIGITVKVQNSKVFLECGLGGVTYQFDLIKPEGIKDGIYTNASISLVKGRPFLSVNTKFWRSFKRYISIAEFNAMKGSYIEKIHKPHIRKVVRIARSNKPKAEQSQEIYKLSKKFIFNLIDFIKSSKEKYCNLDNKTSITDKFEIYNYDVSCKSENQALSFAELKFQILQEYAPYVREEITLKTLVKLLTK